MKQLLLFFSLFILFHIAIGQTDTTHDYFDRGALKTNKGLKGHWGVNAGGFAGSFNHNSYYGSFLSPNYTLDLTSKFSVQAGYIYSTFNTSGISNSEGTQILPRSFNNSFVYAQGIYKVSDKVFLTGGAYTSLIKPAPNTLNPAFQEMSKGGKFGIGYNISETSSIYFEMQFNKGNSPFHTNSSPFSDHSFGNPLVGW